MAGLHTKPIEGKTELDTESSNHLSPNPVTGRKIDTNKRALDTVALGYFHLNSAVPNRTVVSGDTSIIGVTGHAARTGDLVRFVTTSNAVGMYENYIESIVDANNFKLVSPLFLSITAGDIVQILRGVAPRYSSDGASLAQLTPDPIKFLYNGAIIDVAEDTVTPANNKPLPVKLTGITGDINITAGDLNVQLSHAGPVYFDSTRIGDGTNLLVVTGLGEAKVLDSQALAELQAILAKLIADPATSVNQDTIITALGSLLTELQLKADQTQDQPVSVSSLPLPSGAATAAGQGLLLDELKLKADQTEDQPVSVSSLPLPSGAATAAIQGTQQDSLDLINTGLGAPADSAATTDTGTFSIIAFIKRALQNWTTLLLKIPTLTLTSGVSAAALRVVIATDQPAVPLKEEGSNAAPGGTSVTVDTTVGTIAAPSGNPYQLWLQADITNSDNIRVSMNGVVLTATNGWQLLPGASIGPIHNLSVDIKYIAETTNGQRLNYIWSTRA